MEDASPDSTPPSFEAKVIQKFNGIILTALNAVGDWDQIPSSPEKQAAYDEAYEAYEELLTDISNMAPDDPARATLKELERSYFEKVISKGSPSEALLRRLGRKGAVHEQGTDEPMEAKNFVPLPPQSWWERNRGKIGVVAGALAGAIFASYVHVNPSGKNPGSSNH